MASRFQPPPMVDAARRLCAEVEQIVRDFPQYHRYRTGDKLRDLADEVLICAMRTWRKKDNRLRRAEDLVDAVDRFKERLQVCKQAHAFKRFAQFERLSKAAHELGAQAGGWKKSVEQHPNTQNAQADGVAQRGERLSTRAARSRANA
ncbi:MAG: four helix bundle protein [Proteobacteria bacterium]|nr:four helix bundle protein [Pseudomonadota bacterium]